MVKEAVQRIRYDSILDIKSLLCDIVSPDTQGISIPVIKGDFTTLPENVRHFITENVSPRLILLSAVSL